MAIHEFAEKGYSGASINSIVQRLGIAKGSIYQYFGDKNGLFLFIFTKSMEMVKDYLRKVRDTTNDAPLSDRLQKTLSAGVCFINDHPVIYKLYVKILAESSMPFREEILLSLRSYSLEFINSLLETAERKGELKKGTDIIKAGFVIDAVMDRFLLSRTIHHVDASLGIYDGEKKSIDIWISTIVEMICGGIEAPASNYRQYYKDE